MRKPLYFTFGNHMHWVDMEWLWGYHVLPGSVSDMLHLMAETGTRGCLNFDGVGYEKMATECPEALAALRAAVQEGKAEVVGASYGQPYGLFQGGESNVRQRVYGVRTVLRLLGVRPRAFWEEEFDFFPQLPQILAGCGFTGACLFFQWTWHTPEVPREPHSLILWEGLDGTRLPTLPRNDLNLHQWPEDFDQILESPLIRELEKPALVQWVELMPSPDWMCRSEVLLPKLRELLQDPRFEIRPRTLSGLIEALSTKGAPVRRYSLDEVWHGVSLGKNGDRHPRESLAAEREILGAESLSALAGMLGRPYASWDVYPTWELEESWRRLLVFQHHDNHECEGLCGALARAQGSGREMAAGVVQRTLQHLGRRMAAPRPAMLAWNPLPWTRDLVLPLVPGGPPRIVREVPSCGYRVIALDAMDPVVSPEVEEEDHHIVLRRGALVVRVDRQSGRITDLRSEHFPEGALHGPLGRFELRRQGREVSFNTGRITLHREPLAACPYLPAPLLSVQVQGDEGSRLGLILALHPRWDALVLLVSLEQLERPDPGMHAGLQLLIDPAIQNPTLLADHPYAVTAIEATRTWRRKYPSGDWMTSPQWFEDIHRPFVAQSFVDLWDEASKRGLLYLHDGSQSFFRTATGIANLLTMDDPWDGLQGVPGGSVIACLRPHGPMSVAERVRASREFTADIRTERLVLRENEEGDLPALASAFHLEAQSVMATAFYRETEEAGRHLQNYAGRGLGYPHVLRLVEFGGERAEAVLRVPGRVARAYRTNLMGEIEAELRAQPCGPPPLLPEAPWSAMGISLRPREIATLYLDLEIGRKVPRDLDAHRKVWATVHRRPTP